MKPQIVRMKKFLGFLLFFALFRAEAAVVDTVSIYSKAMNKTSKCVVVRPFIEGHRPIPLPVVYLLHGYSGNYSNWITRVPQLRQLADLHQMIIVCPDGATDSWYFDSPIDQRMQYETYIAKEVPAFIDSAYMTIDNRKGRFITGLSMGGHGSLFIALRHPQTFSAGGSMSGAVDINSLRNKYDLMKRIGDTVQHAATWKAFSVLGAVENYSRKDSLSFIIDCGTEDFLYADNRRLHQRMLELKIPHEYTERPGNHNWTYWANAVQYHMLFFRNLFDRKK